MLNDFWKGFSKKAWDARTGAVEADPAGAKGMLEAFRGAGAKPRTDTPPPPPPPPTPDSASFLTKAQNFFTK